jgi:exonuclease VII small subunit
MELANDGMKKLDHAEKKVELLLKEDGKERRVPFLQEEEEGST